MLLGCLVGLALAAPGVQAQDSSTPAAASTLQVEKHRFGLGVIDREIQDEIDTFHKDEVVYLWMRVVGGPSDPILVTWSSGDVRYDVELRIGGSPWRTWARKTLFRAGAWRVEVKDAAGNLLFEHSLDVLESPRSDEE